MKTPEELNALKEEFEALNKKLSELTEDELTQVAGGDEGSANQSWRCLDCGAHGENLTASEVERAVGEHMKSTNPPHIRIAINC